MKYKVYSNFKIRLLLLFCSELHYRSFHLFSFSYHVCQRVYCVCVCCAAVARHVFRIAKQNRRGKSSDDTNEDLVKTPVDGQQVAHDK